MVLLLSSESQDPFEAFPLQTTTWQSRVFWRPETSSLFLRHQRSQVMTWELPTIFIQTCQKPKNPHLIWCWVSARKSLIPEAPPHCVPRRAGCHLQGPPHGRQYIYRFGCQLPNNSCMHRIPQICRGFWYYFHRHSVEKKKDVWKTKSHKFSPTWSNSCCSRGLMTRKTCSNLLKKLLQITQEVRVLTHKMFSEVWLPGLGLLGIVQFYDITVTVCTMQFLWKHRGTAFARGGRQGKSLANGPNLPWHDFPWKAWMPLDAIFLASWPGPVWSESFFPSVKPKIHKDVTWCSDRSQ